MREAEVELKNNFNYDYIGAFFVGNPPQEIRACFDTGSANAWILSSSCNNERCMPGSFNKYFDPFESNTFTNTSKWTSILFGSGALTGYFGIDDFRVGQGFNKIHIKE
jgi:phytepsin